MYPVADDGQGEQHLDDCELTKANAAPLSPLTGTKKKHTRAEMPTTEANKGIWTLKYLRAVIP